MQGARAEALAAAEKAAQEMISKALAEVERAKSAAAEERAALEKAVASATAEVDHWKARSAQKEQAVQALEHDITEVLKVRLLLSRLSSSIPRFRRSSVASVCRCCQTRMAGSSSSWRAACLSST